MALCLLEKYHKIFLKKFSGHRALILLKLYTRVICIYVDNN